MGNKNSAQQNTNLKNEENNKILEKLKIGISKYLKSDKTTNECLNVNKNNNFNIFRQIQKSNLKENLESNNILDFCLELSSSLIGKSLNHEINTTFYNSVTIHKLYEFTSDADIMNQQNNLVIDWIHKTLLKNKIGKYDNWLPQKKESNWLDKLYHVSSIRAQSDINISSYEISNNDVSLDNYKKKKKNYKKNTFTERENLNKTDKNALNKDNLSNFNKKSTRTLSAGLIEKDEINSMKKNKKSQIKSPSNNNLNLNLKYSGGSNIIKCHYNNTSPSSGVKKRYPNTKKQNDDQKTVNSLLNLMSKNGREFSSQKKDKLKLLDSINKLGNKKLPEEFNISLNTFNTKNSGILANLHSSGKSKPINSEKINKPHKNKIIELNKMNPSSEILFINEENIPESIQTKKCHSENEGNRTINNNFVRPSPLSTNQNQIINLTNENQNGDIINHVQSDEKNFTNLTNNQITSNINKTEIIGMTMKNNYLKSNKLKTSENLNNNTNNKISEHMEESRKYESIRSKVPLLNINSRSISKNKTSLNNTPVNKEINANIRNTITNPVEKKILPNNNKIYKKINNFEKKKSNLKKDKTTKTNFKRYESNNIKIFFNENVTNSQENMQSNKYSNNLNNTMKSTKSIKRVCSQANSKEKDKCKKECNFGDFILNNIEPLKINDLNRNSKNNLEIEKIEKSLINEYKKERSKKKHYESIKIDIRELIRTEENEFCQKEEFHVFQKYRKPSKNKFTNNKNLTNNNQKAVNQKNIYFENNKISSINEKKGYEKRAKNWFENQSTIKTEENNIKDYDLSLEQLRDLYENPKARKKNNNKIEKITNNTNYEIHNHLKKLKARNTYLNRNFNNHSLLKNITNDNDGKSDEETMEGQNKPARINIIKLKDFIMKLDVPKYNLDLKALDLDLPYHEIIKHFKESNKFLFEMTNEEIELNNKLKSFHYVNLNFDETIDDDIKIHRAQTLQNENKKINIQSENSINKDSFDSVILDSGIEEIKNFTK